MVIEILQAGTGDSIWVSHNKKNIVIDGGKSTAAIRAKYSKMPQDEIIDLLVVTHNKFGLTFPRKKRQMNIL